MKKFDFIGTMINQENKRLANAISDPYTYHVRLVDGDIIPANYLCDAIMIARCNHGAIITK